MEFQEIYRDHADAYDRLVNAEDCDHNLLPTIEHLMPLSGVNVMEIGAGTGRITRLLMTRNVTLLGVDLSAAMLKVGRDHMQDVTMSQWALVQADGQNLPSASGWADIAIAGWVYGHFRSWFAPDWQQSIGRAVAEMARTVKPGGLQVIIETLGTGNTEPAAPNADLEEYYQWLQNVHGFTRQSLRTDYNFASVDEAAEVTGFFFGDEFAARVRREKWSRVPECTGLWWKRK
jgi:ubiquinone/menaquinone biosynthesis C-methylase UbiE